MCLASYTRISHETRVPTHKSKRTSVRHNWIASDLSSGTARPRNESRRRNTRFQETYGRVLVLPPSGPLTHTQTRTPPNYSLTPIRWPGLHFGPVIPRIMAMPPLLLMLSPYRPRELYIRRVFALRNGYHDAQTVLNQGGSLLCCLEQERLHTCQPTRRQIR